MSRSSAGADALVSKPPAIGGVTHSSNGVRTFSPALSDPRPSPPLPDKKLSQGTKRRLNGDIVSHAAETLDDSEAETLVLSSPEKARTSRPAKIIKIEGATDGDRGRQRRYHELGAKSDRLPRKERSPSTKQGAIKSEADERNGTSTNVTTIIHSSPFSASPSSSDNDSDSGNDARAGATSTTERELEEPNSRRRKALSEISERQRVSSNPNRPRQKSKTHSGGRVRDDSEERSRSRSPNVDFGSGIRRSHRRTVSTQSTLPNGRVQKRRKVPATLLPTRNENSVESDSSSELTSFFQPQTRTKKSNGRSLVSPAKTIPHAKKGGDGRTALARACAKGDLSLVRQAYDKAPEELDVADNAGNAPIQLASLDGHDDIVDFLISKGCRVEISNDDGDTPLIDAVENGQLPVVMLLLKAGADPLRGNRSGQQPLELLEEADLEEFHDEIKAALQDAIKNRAINERKESAEGDNVSHASSHSQQNSPGLSHSTSRRRGAPSKREDLNFVSFRVKDLREHAAKGDAVAVDMLLQGKVKPDNSCGVAAAQGGHTVIMELLLSSGFNADPDPAVCDYQTPMLAAIGRGHLGMIDLLLKQENLDPTRCDREGRTYYEVSADRRGPEWQREAEKLKAAYDEYAAKHKTKPSKSRKSLSPSTKRSAASKDGTIHRREPSPAPLTKKDKSRPLPMEGHVAAKREVKEPLKSASDKPLVKATMVRKRANSDVTETKKRAISDALAAKEIVKPRRKLISGRQMNSDRERESLRRKRVVEESSSDSDDTESVPVSKVSKTVHGNAVTGKIRKPSPALSNASTIDITRKVNGKDKLKQKRRDPSETRSSVDRADIDSVRSKRSPSPQRSVGKLSAELKPGGSVSKRIRDSRTPDDRDVTMRDTPTEEAKGQVTGPAKEESEKVKAEALAEARAIAEREERDRLEAVRQAEEAERTQREAAEKIRREEAERAQREEAERQKIAAEEAAQERRKWLLGLPPAISKALNLSHEPLASQQCDRFDSIRQFLPIFVVRLVEINPDCQESQKQDLWMLNFQAACLLRLDRLDLDGQNWEKRPVTRQERQYLTYTPDLVEQLSVSGVSADAADRKERLRAGRDSKAKFMDMEPLFWIPFKEFLSSTTNYSHLKDVRITTSGVCHVDYVDVKPLKPLEPSNGNHKLSKQQRKRRAILEAEGKGYEHWVQKMRYVRFWDPKNEAFINGERVVDSDYKRPRTLMSKMIHGDNRTWLSWDDTEATEWLPYELIEREENGTSRAYEKIGDGDWQPVMT